MAKKQIIEIPEIIDISAFEETKKPEVETPEIKTKKRTQIKLEPKKLLLIVLVIIAISGVSGSFYFYKKYTTLKNNPNIEATKETERLVSALGKLMELPTNETPTIATISDKEKLKDQAFFAEADNGDVLFAYTTAMKAILYRPLSNKIINVAPISINQPQNVTKGVKNSISPATNTP